MFKSVNYTIILLFSICISVYSQITVSQNYTGFTNYSNYKIEEVIDARPDKSVLGICYKSNSEVLFDTIKNEGNLDSELKLMFDNCIVVKKDIEPSNLILKVNYSEFNYRFEKDKKIYMVYYDLEVFKKNKDNSLSRVYADIEVLEGVATKKNKNDSDEINFWTLQNKIWNNFNAKLSKIDFKWKAKKSDFIVSNNQLRITFILPKIFTDSIINVGNYANKEEMLANLPSQALSKLKSQKKIGKDAQGKVKYEYPNEHFFASFLDKNIIVKVDYPYQRIPIERLGSTFEVAGVAENIYNRNVRSRSIAVGLSAVDFLMPITSFNPIGLGLDLISLAFALDNSIKNYRYLYNSNTGKLSKIMVVNISV